MLCIIIYLILCCVLLHRLFYVLCLIISYSFCYSLMACAGWPEATGRPGRWLPVFIFFILCLFKILFVCHEHIRNFVLFILGIYVCMYVCMHACMYVYVCIYIYIHICIYVYIYIYIYTHIFLCF